MPPMQCLMQILFSKQNFGFFEWIKLMWLEEDAFVSEFMPSIIDWLNELKNLNLSPSKNTSK